MVKAKTRRKNKMKHTTLVPYSLFLIPFLFVGCDYVERRATDVERADKLYQAAMAEYAAGRLDKSIEAFEKVLKANPGNGSARFQLACLLQDHRKDSLGALCNYREYTALTPNGDKVKIAADRSAACERQLATVLIRKYDLGGTVAQDEANARLQADKAKLEKELDATKKEMEKLQVDFAALRRENERVRRMVMAGASDDAGSEEVKVKSEEVRTDSVSKGGVVAGKRQMPALPDEKDLLEEDDVGMDRVKMSSDIDNLIAEEKEETSQAAPFGKTVKPVEVKKAVPQAPPHEPRPKTYVVQEGDTLFKLAVRFYGLRSAWTHIRDANKATVSSDGRIKAGQTLKFP